MTRTRRATLALTTTLAALSLAACSSSEDDPTPPAPDYEVITEDLPAGGIGEVDLLMPDAEVADAEAAIRAYADGIDGPDAVTISVVRAEAAAVIVCRADWPDIDDTMNCPDPGSSPDEQADARAQAGVTDDLTAEAVVEAMSELYPLPGQRPIPQEFTGHENDPLQVIGTDPVIVYELQTEAAAQHWAETMNGTNGNDSRAIGRFMLNWQGDYPSSEQSVEEMTARAEELITGQ